MTPESPQSLPVATSRHAISPARDRLQSRLLVCTLAPILATLNLYGVTVATAWWHLIGVLFVKALLISSLFALAVWRLRAATAPAALCGGLICLPVALYTGVPSQGVLRSGLTALILLFLLTFAATRAGRLRKQRIGLAEPRRGRSASQVLANLGAAGLIAAASPTLAPHLPPLALPVLLVAALAEATADTVSSEIGQAFGGQPILLTTLRPVPPGTDGAISLLGTAAGILAAALVAAVAPWALHLTLRNTFIALSGGIAGLFFDSLLGATIERRGCLGNDLVNLASTLFAALVALTLLMATSPI